MRLSDTSSPPLRLELTPSRWLEAALAVLALCAAFSVLLSALPWPAALLLPPLWWQARSALHRHGRVDLLLRSDASVVMLHADTSETPVVWRAFAERGPLAIVTIATPSGLRRIATAPDTLDAAARRRVRLWAGRHAAANHVSARDTSRRMTPSTEAARV